MIYKNGDAFEILWKENKPQGKGTFLYQDGSQYTGL